MARFRVEVERTASHVLVFEVEADTEEESRILAVDEAHDRDFKDGKETWAEYGVVNLVTSIEEPA